MYLEFPLDWSSDVIDKDLWEISSNISHWDRELSTHLGLDHDDVNEIMTSASREIVGR